MNRLSKYTKLSFWCGLLLIFIIGVNISCASSSSPQNPNPLNTTSLPTSTITFQSNTVPPTYAPIVLNQATDIPPRDIVLEMIGKVNRDLALADLKRLTGEDPICDDLGCYTVTNRKTGSEGLQRVKKYITDELGKLGYSVEVYNWSRSGYSDQDLIIKKQGITSPGESVFFIAHMDAIAKDQIGRYPGADDNASGVVDILELARVLGSYSFKRTLVLFLSTGEEQGSLGAKSYLNQLTSLELSSIKYAINIDMIGYDANHDEAMQLFHGNQAPSKTLAQMMHDTIIQYQLNLSPTITAGCP
jgi:hypothetical protein